MTPRSISRLLGLLLVTASVARAQTGTIAGRITDTTSAAPLSGATVRAVSGSSTAASATAGEDGAYRIVNIAPGTYDVVVTRIGYLARRITSVRVTAGQTAQVDVHMAELVTQLNPAVVVASRQQEKVLDAPASVSVVETREIEERPSVTVADHLRGLQGVDATQGGIAQTNIVTRGFNNAFSGALLTLTDYRFAGVPSLRVNVPLLFTGTNEDIERIEVLLGPASALYGPNSSSGVLHVISKSPFTSKGTILTIDGGERSIFRGGFRHANTVGQKVAYKLSAEYFRGKDWETTDPAEPLLVGRPNGTPGSRDTVANVRDNDVERVSGEGRFDVRPRDGMEFITTYGYSKIGSGLELTGTNGTAQAKNWSYQSIQERFRWGRLFAQVFMNVSDAGNKDSLDTKGTYLLRTGTPIVDNSKVYAAQLQHGADLFKGKESLVYGADYIFTNPQTGNTINGRNEDIDDVKEVGAYIQSTTHLSKKFDFVGAIRVDNHDVLDQTFWSPRIAMIFKPSETQNIRLTYNRAFSTPANFSFFLDLPQAFIPITSTIGYQVRGLGVPSSGFTFRRDCATGAGQLCMRSPFPITGPTGTPTGAPNTVVDANAAQYYRTLVGGNQQTFVNGLLAAGVSQANVATVFGAIFGANTANVQTKLRLFRPPGRGNPTPSFLEVQPSSVEDIERLKATTTDAYEVGYKGILGNRARLAIDLWYQRKTNFTTAAQNVTPNAFLDPTTLGAAIGAALTAQAQAGRVPAAAVQALATQFTTALAQVPIGTVVPEGSLTNSPSLFFSYRNIDETIDYSGVDLALDYLLTDRVTVIGTYSWVSDVVFPDIVNGPDTLTLNSPDNKASLTTRYRDEARGLSFELRGRYANAYPVNSGVYVGEVPVNAFLDASFSWRLPIPGQNLMWSLTGTNITDNKRITFIGTPRIGRMIMTRLQYSF
ncbi:MAG TPA: TonB-dependent receptor [Gemmatimonadaceae bacterium]|nr:TonB-dependent receptor [Gemmatimonadaceae bacterium]